MIVVLLNVYLVILFILVKLKIVPFNLFWKISPVIVLLLLLVGLFSPMGWGAPCGPALVGRQSVAIAPNVAGEVIEVAAEPNKPLKANDVLFRIDPVPYEAKVKALEAQLKFQELRLSQMTELQTRGTGRAFDVEQRHAEVDQLRAQLDGAKWDLDKTVVRAPTDGYVTNVALQKGTRVASAPVMAFIGTAETIVVVEIAQIDARYLAPGQPSSSPSSSCPVRFIPARSKLSCRQSRPARPSPPGWRRRPRERSPRRSSCGSRSTIPRSPANCLPAAPVMRRSSPIGSRQPMSYARCSCDR